MDAFEKRQKVKDKEAKQKVERGKKFLDHVNYEIGRRKETGAFYYHLPVPIQEQLVIFCEGNLETSETEYNVTVTYKDDMIEVGKITNSRRCLLWKQTENSVPESMTSKEENGMAKLLVEKLEVPAQTENTKIAESSSKADFRGVNENTPQITEEMENTPERPQKKRKTSLNKDEKTPTGQVTKKQKTQKLPTRLRTGKEETKINVLSPKSERTNKTNSILTADKHKSLSQVGVDRKGLPDKLDKKMKRKDSTDHKSSNMKKALGVSENGPNKETVTLKSSKGSGTKQGKLTPRSNVEKNLMSNKSETDDVEQKQNEKSVKMKTGIKKKTEILDDTEIQSKRTRITKTKNQTENIVTDEDESLIESRNIHKDTDKENVQMGNIKEKDTGVEKLTGKEVLTISDVGKTATCKDLTLRALDRPSGRWGHSLCFINRNMSVLIGGQGEKQQISKDSVWTLDCETRRWKDPETQAEGQKPEYRMGHTATYDPLVRCIYVFGGSKNTRWFHDVHILDIEEWKWQLVKVNGKAPTRAYHSATLYRHELWIFGGVYPRPDPQPDGCSNDVHIFSPVMESWYSPIVSGEKPIPRSGHSATLINDQLVVFGGWDAPISYNDLHVLDLSIVEWSKPKFTGSPPSPRSWHASCALSGNKLLIHGGYNGDFALDDTHIFNLDELSWIRIHVENQPSARVGHKALCMPYRHDNEEEDEVIVFGGGDNDGAYFDDLYSIYVPFKPAAVL